MKGGKLLLITSAALWRIEDNKEDNGEKILYILNNIPIKLGESQIHKK